VSNALVQQVAYNGYFQQDFSHSMIHSGHGYNHYFSYVHGYNNYFSYPLHLQQFMQTSALC
jgi:hypothetical protein